MAKSAGNLSGLTNDHFAPVSAEAEYHLAHDPEAGRLEFQADDEQQEYDTEFREVQDVLRLVDEPESERADQDSRAQVTEHGTKPQALADRHADDCREQIDDGFLENCHTAIPGGYEEVRSVIGAG